jgi:hypothetical protein
VAALQPWEREAAPARFLAEGDQDRDHADGNQANRRQPTGAAEAACARQLAGGKGSDARLRGKRAGSALRPTIAGACASARSGRGNGFASPRPFSVHRRPRRSGPSRPMTRRRR